MPPRSLRGEMLDFASDLALDGVELSFECVRVFGVLLKNPPGGSLPAPRVVEGRRSVVPLGCSRICGDGFGEPRRNPVEFRAHPVAVRDRVGHLMQLTEMAVR